MAVLHGKNYGKPSLDLNFAGNKSLIDTTTGTNYVTFSRAQSGNEATYVGSDGLIKYASADEPRFDHDPVTGESLGLLVEEARTNLIKPSTFGFDAIAPDQTFTAKKQIKPSGLAGNYVDIPVSYGNNTYTFSCYAKAAEWTWLGLWINNGSQAGSSFFRLDNLSLGYGHPGTTLQIVDVGNGWRRCSVTFTHSGTTSTSLRIYPENNGGPGASTGDGTSGVYIWGAQLEQGSFPTSYIPTSGSTVTRAVDVASITGTNFSSWFNQSEGTFTNHIIALEGAENRGNVDYGAWVGATNTTTRIRSEYAAGVTVAVGQVYPTNPAPGVIAEGSFLTTTTAVIDRKSAFAYNYDSVGFAFNGVLGARDSFNPAVGTITDADRMYLTGFALDVGLNKYISRIAYWPKRLPDIELQQLTK